MNIAQAKAVAGIAPQIKIVGSKGAEDALAQVKRRMVEARRAGNDAKAAELSEAKAAFLRMLKNICPVCGVAIAPGARACSVHARGKVKALALPAGWERPTSKSRRVDVAPKGGPLAHLGYYAPAVQKVIGRWQRTIRPEHLKFIFAELANVASGRSRQLRVPFIIPKWLPAVCELGAAVARVWRDKSKPAAWLLRLPIGVAEDGNFPSWNQIRQQIIRQGGRPFSTDQLKNAAKRLRLLTPTPLAADWQRLAPCVSKKRPN